MAIKSELFSQYFLIIAMMVICSGCYLLEDDDDDNNNNNDNNNQNGQLVADTSFGNQGNGFVVINNIAALQTGIQGLRADGDDLNQQIAFNPANGNIMAVGRREENNDEKVLLVELTSNGNLSAAFNNGQGFKIVDFAGNAIATDVIFVNGSPIIVGNEGGNAFVMRLQSNGSGEFENDFAQNGILSINGSNLEAVAVDNQNNLYVGGQQGNDFLLAKIDFEDGSILALETIDLGGNDQVKSVAVDNNNRILLYGESDKVLSVVRTGNANLQLDTSFNQTGILQLDEFGNNITVTDLAVLQNDEIILVATNFDLGNGSGGIFAVKVDDEGEKVEDFGEAGVVVSGAGFGASLFGFGLERFSIGDTLILGQDDATNFIRKLDTSSGEVIEVFEFPVVTQEQDEQLVVFSIVGDQSGNILVAGSVSNVNNSNLKQVGRVSTEGQDFFIGRLLEQ